MKMNVRLKLNAMKLRIISRMYSKHIRANFKPTATSSAVRTHLQIP